MLTACATFEDRNIPDTPDFRYWQSAYVERHIAELDRGRCERGEYTGKNISTVKTHAGQRLERPNPEGKGKLYVEQLDYYYDVENKKSFLGMRELHGMTITFSTTDEGLVIACRASDQRIRRR